jgi:hypothetical protein
VSEGHRLLHGLVQGHAEAGWAHLWTSTLVLAVALLAARWRRLAPEAREAVLSLGLAKLLLPGTLSLLALRAAGWEPGSDAPSIAPLAGTAVEASGDVVIELAGAPGELPCLLVAFWWVGVASCVSLRAHRRRRLLGELTALAAPLAPNDPLRPATAALGGGGVTLLRGAGAAPLTFGTRRPVIVLPAAGELDPAVEHALLAHEIAHVRRHDDLRARLTGLLAALFWFHPLAWIAAHRLALAREAACDRASAREVGLAAYLAALDHVCRGALAPAGLVGWAGGALRERIALLMDAQHLRLAPSRLVALVALLAVGAAIVASGFAAPLPAQGSATSPAYRLGASIAPRGEALVVSAELDDAAGAALARPEVVLSAGDVATVRSRTEDGQEIAVTVRLDRRGRGGVRARVERGDEVLFDRTVAVAAPGAPSISAGFAASAPISFSLSGADLHEVLWTLARMAGLGLSLQGDVEGSVTVELQEVPWSEALDVITRTNGLGWRVDGGELVVSAAP